MLAEVGVIIQMARAIYPTEKETHIVQFANL